MIRPLTALCPLTALRPLYRATLPYRATPPLPCYIPSLRYIPLQDSASQHELHVLQLRPQAGLGTSSAATRFRYLPTKQYASVTSKHALGHGRFEEASYTPLL